MPPDDDRSVAPVKRDGEVVAALIYDRSLDEDPELVEAVGGAAAIALENQQLLAEAEIRLAEVRASRERVISPRTPNGVGSSATCTTAPNSAWSRLRCNSPHRTSDPRRSFRRGAACDLGERRVGAVAGGAARAGPRDPPGCFDRGAALRGPDHGVLRARPRRASLAFAAYFVASEALANTVKHARASAAAEPSAHRNRRRDRDHR